MDFDSDSDPTRFFDCYSSLEEEEEEKLEEGNGGMGRIRRLQSRCSSNVSQVIPLFHCLCHHHRNNTLICNGPNGKN